MENICIYKRDQLQPVSISRAIYLQPMEMDGKKSPILVQFLHTDYRYGKVSSNLLAVPAESRTKVQNLRTTFSYLEEAAGTVLERNWESQRFLHSFIIL